MFLYDMHMGVLMQMADIGPGAQGLTSAMLTSMSSIYLYASYTCCM